MGRKQTPGLFKKGNIWHIDKRIEGKRVCKSCNTSNLAEAESYLAFVIEEHRRAKIYGIRPKRRFSEAAEKYIQFKSDKKSIESDISRLSTLMPFIGDIFIDDIHMDVLADWIDHRTSEGRRSNTINHGLKVVRQVLNCAASDFRDEHGLTWLRDAPKIKLLKVADQKPAYPLNWNEQDRLLSVLPPHLHDMALFAINSGCRDQEICNLIWDLEIEVPQLDTSVFFLPKELTKMSRDRYVVLNRTAKQVIDSRRGIHTDYVFSFQGRGLYQMNNTGWQKSRVQANLPSLRVHDLRHTCATRLRAAGVTLEDRKELLGHKSSDVTTGYSLGELTHLIEQANKICPDSSGETPDLLLLRPPSLNMLRKFHEGKKKGYAGNA
jgi:integrase